MRTGAVASPLTGAAAPVRAAALHPGVLCREAAAHDRPLAALGGWAPAAGVARTLPYYLAIGRIEEAIRSDKGVLPIDRAVLAVLAVAHSRAGNAAAARRLRAEAMQQLRNEPSLSWDERAAIEVLLAAGPVLPGGAVE